MNIKPLYKSGNEILVGLADDFREVCVLDGLVIIIDLDNKKIKKDPWSGQEILRQGDYKPIMKDQKEEYKKKIRKSLRKRRLAEIENKLQNPPSEAVNSLIWTPDRLVGSNSEKSN